MKKMLKSFERYNPYEQNSKFILFLHIHVLVLCAGPATLRDLIVLAKQTTCTDRERFHLKLQLSSRDFVCSTLFSKQ